nr:ubiquitin hydrolase [Tanacetum cinerariifolium]
MVKSSSYSKNEPCCSKDCKKNTETLNKKITDLEDKLFDAKNMIYHYKLGLEQVESRLVEYKEIEVKYYEKIRTLEFRTESNNECIKIFKKKLETLKQEKEGVDGKLAGLLTSSKDLDNLIESQRADKNKEGLRYSVVPYPPAQIYSSPKKDMSWTGLPEFVDDTVTDYSRPSPTVESTSGDDQNKNPSVTKIGASDSTILSKPVIKFVKAVDKAAERPTTDKVETAKKPAVRYAELYRKPSKKSTVKGNQRNWNNLKSQQIGNNFVMKKKTCYNCGHFDHLSYDCGLRVKIGRSSPKNNYTRMRSQKAREGVKSKNSSSQGIEFPLTEEVPTASEEGCHCQKKRDATARKIALLSKSRRNCQSKSNDSLTKFPNLSYFEITQCDNNLRRSLINSFHHKQAIRDKEKELWVELKRRFEPHSKDRLWTYHQAFMHDPLDWKLYDTCGVHHVSTKRNQEIFMLVEKDNPLRKGLATVMIVQDEELFEVSSLVIIFLSPSLDRSRQRHFMLVRPSPPSVSTILQEIWCRYQSLKRKGLCGDQAREICTGNFKEDGMEDCNATLCPMEPGLKLSKKDEPAEFMIATAAVCQAIWLRKLLAEITGNDQVIFERKPRDNQRAYPLRTALACIRFKEM